MARQAAQRSTSTVKEQDPAISDVSRGLNTDVTKSEDQKRAEGTDASASAGEHDYSPEADIASRTGGSVLATYGDNSAQPQHGNIAGPAQPLIVGQAPDAPNTPMRGSENFGHKFHPDVPNPKNQSPMVRGMDRDPRNDPSHPAHEQADRAHPDYGKPAAQHSGRQSSATSYAELRRKAEDGKDVGAAEVEPVEPVS